LRRQSVEPPGHPNLEAPHCAAERGSIGGLDDQVKMVALHREMNEAHIQPFLRRRTSPPVTSLQVQTEPPLRFRYLNEAYILNLENVVKRDEAKGSREGTRATAVERDRTFARQPAEKAHLPLREEHQW
jgi:hypothetical protein